MDGGEPEKSVTLSQRIVYSLQAARIACTAIGDLLPGEKAIRTSRQQRIIPGIFVTDSRDYGSR